MSAPRHWILMAHRAVRSRDMWCRRSVAASAAELPEGRVYELVTPPEGYDTEIYPPGEEALFPLTKPNFPTRRRRTGTPYVFPAGPTVGGNETSGWYGGNQYLASRSPAGGWSEVNMSPATDPAPRSRRSMPTSPRLFSIPSNRLTPSSPGFGEEPEPYYEGNYDVLYSMNTKTAEYAPLFTVKPPYRAPSELQTAGEIFRLTGPLTGGYRGFRTLAFAGASTDDSHLLFLANDALTAASEGRPAAEGGSAAASPNVNNLYEWFDGRLRLVNVLPDGSTHVNATFGGGPLFNRVISTDGSRIFWTDLSTGHIYVRENGTRTVEVSPAGKFQTASSDGSEAFFINGDLYEYDVTDAHTTDLDPGVPVKRVLGASEDGKYVYFLTEAGELVLWHEGEVTNISASSTGRTGGGHARWSGGGISRIVEEGHNHSCSKPVKVYEAATKELYCVPVSVEKAGEGRAILASTNKANVYQPRWISADGTHVFFESQAPLVPEDSNGKLDAYEWTEPGASGCAESDGCLHLLTGGTSSDGSHFVDAGVNGDDVFVVTRAKLLAADDNELFDLYDVRVDGYQPIAPPACTGSGCQGLPGAPPIFATPSSVTFEGVGNFSASEGKPAVQPKKTQKSQKQEAKSKNRSNTSEKPRRRRARARQPLASTSKLRGDGRDHAID